MKRNAQEILAEFESKTEGPNSRNGTFLRLLREATNKGVLLDADQATFLHGCVVGFKLSDLGQEKFEEVVIRMATWLNTCK